MKVFILMLLAFLLFMIDVYRSQNSLRVSRYELRYTNVLSKQRIVFISDLHGKSFGENNEKLVEMISKEKPDIVCITGDLVNRKVPSLDIAQNAVRELVKVAPIFISLGNQEYSYLDGAFTHKEIAAAYEKAGATVLEHSFEEISVGDTQICIGGFFGYGAPDNSKPLINEDSVFLNEFQKDEEIKILLAHMPLAWYAAGSLDFWNVDLVLCGHSHGGQIRIPFVGGLWAPDLGYFPGKEKGIYTSKDGKKRMVLTTGLGNTEWVPRINNRPEIITIDIMPE